MDEQGGQERGRGMDPLLRSGEACVLVTPSCGLIVNEPGLHRGWGWRVANLFIEALFPKPGRWISGLRWSGPVTGLWQFRQIHAWYAEAEFQP